MFLQDGTGPQSASWDRITTTRIPTCLPSDVSWLSSTCSSLYFLAPVKSTSWKRFSKSSELQKRISGERAIVWQKKGRSTLRTTLRRICLSILAGIFARMLSKSSKPCSAYLARKGLPQDRHCRCPGSPKMTCEPHQPRNQETSYPASIPYRVRTATPLATTE